MRHHLFGSTYFEAGMSVARLTLTAQVFRSGMERDGDGDGGAGALLERARRLCEAATLAAAQLRPSLPPAPRAASRSESDRRGDRGAGSVNLSG